MGFFNTLNLCGFFKESKKLFKNKMNSNFLKIKCLLFLFMGFSGCATLMRGSGDLGLIVERERGSLLLIESTHKTLLKHIGGLGDLSHASIVYSRDTRYGYIFGRDGGLTKVDLLKGMIIKRNMQAGNSIGGAISEDGRYIAVSNYEPGGVRIYDSESLEIVNDIAAQVDGKMSKAVGLVEAPHGRFVFSLFEEGEIWILELTQEKTFEVKKFKSIGSKPYDALLSPDGRYYIAGLFGEDGFALLDLWHLEQGVQRILSGYRNNREALPVYKMPHLQGWTFTDNFVFFPAVGAHEILVARKSDWKLVSRIPVFGQPVFVKAHPNGRHIWVNFAFPKNERIQIIDVETLSVVKNLEPGKGVLHMEFTSKGENVWVSVRDLNKVMIYDTYNFELISQLSADKPSGIFFTSRAHKIGL